MEIERNIELSTSKIAQLYKQEQSANPSFKKGQLKGTSEYTESKIDSLSKKLKANQELLRIFEPRFALLITTKGNEKEKEKDKDKEKKGTTLIFRSENQREEWLKEFNQFRKRAGQEVDREKEKQQLEKEKEKLRKEGFFGEISKSLEEGLTKTVLRSAQALHFLAKSLTGDFLSPGGAGGASGAAGNGKGKLLTPAFPSSDPSSPSSSTSSGNSTIPSRKNTRILEPPASTIQGSESGNLLSFEKKRGFFFSSFLLPFL
jgi:hypothetical protein